MIAVPVLLAALGGLLFVFQWVTLAKFYPLSASVSYLSAAAYWSKVTALVDLGPLDAALAAAIVAGSLAVAFLEVRRGLFTAFLRGVLASEGRTVLLLLSSSLVCARYYLAPGHFNWAADSPQHIAYADIAAHDLRSGLLPTWTWYLGTGSPYLQFYGFLFFWLCAAVDLVLTDLFLSLKVTLAALHVLSGHGAYAAARAGGCRRGAALGAGLGYVLCFWHTQQVLIMGRLQVSIVYALLPWSVWGLERALGARRGGVGRAVLGGALLGLLVLSHPAYGYWACAFTGLYGLVRVAAGPRSLDCWVRGAGLLAATLGTALLVGAALVLPMWLDRGYTGLGDDHYNLVGTPDPHWWQLLVWSNFRFWLIPPDLAGFHWYGGYLGLSLVVAASAAAVGCARLAGLRYRAPVLAAVACLTASLVCVFAYRTPLVQSLPNSGVLGSGRYLLFTSFFLALAAGHGVRALQLGRRRAGAWVRVAPVALLVLVADLGPTTFQHTYGDPDSQLDAAGVSYDFHERVHAGVAAYAARGELPDYRVMWARASLNRFLATGLLYYNTRTPLADGPHPGELHSVFRFVRPFERYANQALAATDDGNGLQLDERVHAGLFLLNVKYLIARSASGQAIGLQLPDHSPVVVAPVLAPSPDPAAALASVLDLDLDRLVKEADPREVAEVTRLLAQLEGMELRSADRACARLFVDGLAAPVDLGTKPRARVLEHRVLPRRVELRVEVTDRCFARLAYGYYPHVAVSVDGARVEPRVTAAGFTAVDLTAGAHDITLEHHLSALRTSLLAVSAVVTFAAALAAAAPWMGRRRWLFFSRRRRPDARPTPQPEDRT